MDPLVGLFDPNDNDEEITRNMPESLPPEVEEGNIEYKLKLVSPSASRFEHLVTQMKWRLQEGDGEAIYEIGVSDNGVLTGLNDHELTASLNTLHDMATKLNAVTSIVREKTVDTPNGSPRRRVAEVLVRKVPESQHFIDLRLAVLGNVDAGKSSLVGVLTHGELDNGRGKARLNLFRHLHEIQTGRTSSISHEILGFSNQGELVNYSDSRTTEDIIESSSKLFTLIDLCGHQKYLKTTIFGLTGYAPDFAMLAVSANTGVVGTTKEHLGYALALEVPIFVVVTKVDQCRGHQIERTMRQMEKILKSPGCKKVPFRVICEDDAVTAAATFNSESTCPIFSVSSVSGKNLDLLTKFLNLLPPPNSSKQRELHMQESAEHQVDEIYTIRGVGLVVGGTVSRGTIKSREEMMLGPTDEGEFHRVKIGSVHRNRMPCRVAAAGQAACLSIGNTTPCPIRKGMVLVSPEVNPVACQEFEAHVYLLFHNGFICKGFQTVIHVGNVMQTAIITKINKSCLQTNDKAMVSFRFINRPEYLKVGARLLFREGRTRGMGEVTRVTPYDTPPHR